MKLTFDGTASVALTNDSTNVLIVFVSVQAIRVTTIDAFPMPGALPNDSVLVIKESGWIAELRTTLSAEDPWATFLDERARHFVIVGSDCVVEVISRDVTPSITVSEVKSPAARSLGAPRGYDRIT